MERRQLNSSSTEILPPKKRLSPVRAREEDTETRQAIADIYEDRKACRPTRYRPCFDHLVYELRLTAVPSDAIARIFAVAEMTLTNWQKDFPSFCAAWEQGGDIADTKVAVAVYNRACGFTRYIEKTAFNQKTGEVHTWSEESYYPPDTQAGIFWLTNRKRGQWRHSMHQEVTGRDGTAISPPSINVTFLPSKVSSDAD